ncbi:MAG: hypothetical protein COB61_003590 [Thiotrichales bacterium]|nr:hypothetical protein [Thiotrichales bacterium]
MRQLIAILLLSLSMVACSKGDRARVPAQLWNDIIFKIETHPYPVKVGFNEIWLKSTKKKGTPASSLIVWLRSNESAEWVQSVQDGHIGVFRRAVKIEEGDEYLYVKLKRGTEETVLHFELPWPQEQ